MKKFIEQYTILCIVIRCNCGVLEIIVLGGDFFITVTTVILKIRLVSFTKPTPLIGGPVNWDIWFSTKLHDVGMSIEYTISLSYRAKWGVLELFSATSFPCLGSHTSRPTVAIARLSRFEVQSCFWFTIGLKIDKLGRKSTRVVEGICSATAGKKTTHFL